MEKRKTICLNGEWWVKDNNGQIIRWDDIPPILYGALCKLREEVEKLKKQLQKKTVRIRVDQNEWRKRGTR